MISLLNLTVNCNHVLQVLHNLVNPCDGGVDAVPGALEADLIPSHISREADHDSSKLISNSPQHLSPPGNKVPMVFGINSHRILNNIVKLLHAGFDNDLGSCNSLLGTYNIFNNIFLRVLT